MFRILVLLICGVLLTSVVAQLVQYGQVNFSPARLAVLAVVCLVQAALIAFLARRRRRA